MGRTGERFWSIQDVTYSRGNLKAMICFENGRLNFKTIKLYVSNLITQVIYEEWIRDNRLAGLTMYASQMSHH